MDGGVRVWEPAPPPARQVCTMRCRSPVLSCCWLNGQLLAYGSASGEVRLHDVSKRRQVLELTGDAQPALRDRRVLHLAAASPSSSLLCSVTSRASSGPSRSDLFIYDLKASRQECTLSLPAGVSCGSAEFNHNGQLLLCACSDGHVRVYDGRMEGCISDWTAHTGAALTVHLSPDQTHIYTLGADNKLVTWSLAQTGSQLSESCLHERASGPFAVHRPGGEPAPQRPYGQLFALDGRHHMLTCGATGGRLYQVGPSGLEHLLSLGGHGAPVLTCDMADNLCVTASLDGGVKTSSLLLPS
ncbi:WD repeat-containing protein 91-like [Amphibalanus amphitrite]|uniref:WD repeat-containing protein 91-like n=1 Tax=Amphibalanus amphitrite TaxID=1232801 RepID=UPI001C902751|nr:WD repeat-containing protein 91-like [Amphibalanus amphitrite]